MKYLITAFLDAKALAAHLLTFLVGLMLSAQLFTGGKLTRDTYVQAIVGAAISALVHALRANDTAQQQAAEAAGIESLIGLFGPVLGKFLPTSPATNGPASPNPAPIPPPPSTPPL